MIYCLLPTIFYLSAPTLLISNLFPCLIFFFFNDTATTEIYTLSLHDALPIFEARARLGQQLEHWPVVLDHLVRGGPQHEVVDRKSTRLNSSHRCISYAVFCLKKKK